MGLKHYINMTIAEFVATFTLVFATVLAGAIDSWHPTAIGALGVAMAEGLAIGVMASAINDLSGSHINPAITISEMATRRMKVSIGLVYLLAQCAGGIAAAASIGLILPRDLLESCAWGSPLVREGISWYGALLTESTLTFFLSFVFYGTVLDQRTQKLSGLYLGLTVMLCVLVGYHVTGGAVNPARHIGPALVAGHYEHFWIYWIGPISGALAAAFLYHYRLHYTQEEGRGLETRELYGGNKTGAGDSTS